MNLSTRRGLATATVPLLLLAAACGGDDSDERATTVTPPSSSSAPASEQPAEDVPAGALSQAQLEDALLTVADLPTGYTQGTVSDEEDSPTGSEDAECAARFQELDELEDTSVATAEAQFEGPALGTFLEQTLSSFASEGEISEQIGEVSAVLSDCPTFTTTDEDGVTSTATISALSFPKLGDETLALSVGVERPDFTASVDIVVIRVGQSLQLLSLGGLSTDAAALEQAARAGTEKLQAVS